MTRKRARILSCTFSFFLSLSPSHSHSVWCVRYGLTNTCATLTGIYGVSITAALIDYGFDWSFAFDVVAVLYLLAAACFMQFGDVKLIFP